MINSETTTEAGAVLLPDCQTTHKEIEHIEETEICQLNTECIEPLLDNAAVVETSEEYHSLSSNSSYQIENIPRTKDASNLVKCGSFISKVLSSRCLFL